MSYTKKVRHLLKKIDYHGHPIGLTYKNERTFKTSIGGVVTLISRLGIFIFFSFLIKNIINKQKAVTTKPVFKSAVNDHQSYSLNLGNFDVAVGL
jgi:hypothetical protein